MKLQGSGLQRSLFSNPSTVEVRGDDHGFLRSLDLGLSSGRRRVRSVDLFCGCGGISLGLREAAASAGAELEVALAADFESSALQVFIQNLMPLQVTNESLERVFHGKFGTARSLSEKRLSKDLGEIDILSGGPPCQGHSDLNNSTRRQDPKNSLYFVMARAAEILRPESILIENVVGAFHDKGEVVQRTADALSSLGYHIELITIDGLALGLPQRRRRLLLLASLSHQPSLKASIADYALPQRSVEWAIGDLTADESSIADRPSTPSNDNRARIDYLFDNELYDLPDSMRPACHRDKQHSYKSVYGRLRWDQPAQTITSGFYSMCMGRYVHPAQRRTLTAHEAARLQFFPDFFRFDSVPSRTSLATIIGNAVPPKLSFVAGLQLLSSLRLQTSAKIA